MTRIVIRCGACNAILTPPLEELPYLSMLSEHGDRIARGFYAVERGDVVVHLLDAPGTRRHPDLARLQGCCGPHGSEGMNRRCENGHEVATERSDCVVPHDITFSRNTVYLERLWLEEAAG